MHRVWRIGINRDHGHALVAVIGGQLLNPLFVHLRDWTVVTSEDNGQDFRGSIVFQAVALVVDAGQVEIRRRRADREYRRSIGRLGGDVVLRLSEPHSNYQNRERSKRTGRKTTGPE